MSTEEEDRRTCYFPDGSVAENNVPCTSSKYTSCCGDTDICLTNGLCMNTGHQPYLLSRGACTKKEWGFGCTSYCASVDKSRGVSMINLDFNSDTPATYCCGTPVIKSDHIVCPNGDEDGFEVKDGEIIYGRAALWNVTATASSPTGTAGAPDSSRTSGTCASAMPCNETAIGAGVGVPLGIIALSAILWALWERRRVRKLATAAAGGPPVPWSAEGAYKKNNNGYGQQAYPVQELDDTRAVQELMGRERPAEAEGVK